MLVFSVVIERVCVIYKLVDAIELGAPGFHAVANIRVKIRSGKAIGSETKF